MMQFNDRVKFLLRKKRVSQVEFAGLLGISPARLNNYLTGKTEASYAIIRAITALLDTSSDYLLGLKTGYLSPRAEITPSDLILEPKKGCYTDIDGNIYTIQNFGAD